jgi:hypothetical protein
VTGSAAEDPTMTRPTPLPTAARERRSAIDANAVAAGSAPGPFDPAFRLDALSREALARLGREYMLLGRALMPIVASRGVRPGRSA